MRTYGLRFDVNCSILFTELPLLARPAAARAAGFDAVEFWWPFEEMVPSEPTRTRSWPRSRTPGSSWSA